jgi:hypothetical protein
LVGIAPDDSKDAFSLFARQYPFLVTKSTKAASIPSYPAEVCKQIPAVFVAKMSSILLQRLSTAE